MQQEYSKLEQIIKHKSLGPSSSGSQIPVLGNFDNLIRVSKLTFLDIRSSYKDVNADLAIAILRLISVSLSMFLLLYDLNIQSFHLFDGLSFN